MKKVIVTGGAGFIGSHLVEELIKLGYYVVVIDDLSTGNIENIGSRLNHIELEDVSIINLSLLQSLFQNANYVFHLAALARVPRSIDNPLEVNQVNITGTLNVLIAARDCGVKKVIFASSSSVYGNTKSLPQQEEMQANPVSPYAVTKLTGEYYCKVFNQIYHLPTVCLRYFCVYGARQDYQSNYSTVIPTFINRAMRGLPLIIYGDGEQSRDFTFIKDVTQGNILAMANGITGVYNIGSGQRTTINELASKLLDLLHSNIKPVYKKTRAGDVYNTLADISAAKNIGYKPEYDIDRGLKLTMEHII